MALVLGRSATAAGTGPTLARVAGPGARSAACRAAAAGDLLELLGCQFFVFLGLAHDLFILVILVGTTVLGSDSSYQVSTNGQPKNHSSTGNANPSFPTFERFEVSLRGLGEADFMLIVSEPVPQRGRFA